MKTIVRKNDEAVSPVIATILMVAITVVLAAVLYVMVSGLVGGPSTTAQSIGVNLSSSGDGTNWIMTFISVPSGLQNNTVSLALVTGSGSPKLPATLLNAAGTLQTNGVVYYPKLTTGVVSAGDYLTISKTTYPSGYGYTLSGPSGVLAQAKLQ